MSKTVSKTSFGQSKIVLKKPIGQVQNPSLTISQGGFDFVIDHETAIRVLDVAFISQHIVLCMSGMCARLTAHAPCHSS
jgi:hypothetical protein